MFTPTMFSRRRLLLQRDERRLEGGGLEDLEPAHAREVHLHLLLALDAEHL